MELEKEQLCDFTAQPSPEPLRFGAGQVNKYRKRESFGPWY